MKRKSLIAVVAGMLMLIPSCCSNKVLCPHVKVYDVSVSKGGVLEKEEYIYIRNSKFGKSIWSEVIYDREKQNYNNPFSSTNL